jgi:hypothetical protein
MQNNKPQKSRYRLILLMLGGAIIAICGACAGPPPHAEMSILAEPNSTGEEQHPTQEKPMTDKTNFTYRIEDKTVSEDEFNAFVLMLEVEAEPYVTADIIDADMGYGGWEAGYHAKDPQTGQAYQVYETQMHEHHSKAVSRIAP